MLEEIKTKLAQIKNPHTGVELEKENRFKSIALENGLLRVTYSRDQISPQEKRVIEEQITETLKALLNPENIMIMTTSSESKEVYQALGPAVTKPTDAKPTELKVGHGTLGNKKPVPGIGKLIAIGSGKGGVGKSTFTVNLACTLAAKGFKVGVIDADIYGPSVPMLLNKRGEKPFSNSEKKIIPLESYGVKFMSFGLFINENDPVIWRGPMLGGVLSQFLFDVDWDGVDYLLIDLPPGTGDIQLSMVQNTSVDGVIIISTPQDVALLDATKGLEMFRKLNLPIIGMIENMSSFVCSDCGKEHFLFGEHGVENAVKKLEVPFLGRIPLELELRVSADTGVPYMSHQKFEGRPVYKGYQEVATRVHEFFSPSPETPAKKNIFSKIFGG